MLLVNELKSQATALYIVYLKIDAIKLLLLFRRIATRVMMTVKKEKKRERRRKKKEATTTGIYPKHEKS